MESRIAAIYEALKYNEVGLDLIIQALKDESSKVKWTTLSVLQNKMDSPTVRQAVLKDNPWKLTTCLYSFTIKIWDLQSGYLLHTLKYLERLSTFGISPDRKIITCHTGYNIKVWGMPS